MSNEKVRKLLEKKAPKGDLLLPLKASLFLTAILFISLTGGKAMPLSAVLTTKTGSPFQSPQRWTVTGLIE